MATVVSSVILFWCQSCSFILLWRLQDFNFIFVAANLVAQSRNIDLSNKKCTVAFLRMRGNEDLSKIVYISTTRKVYADVWTFFNLHLHWSADDFRGLDIRVVFWNTFRIVSKRIMELFNVFVFLDISPLKNENTFIIFFERIWILQILMESIRN